jgi:hypothetical protein
MLTVSLDDAMYISIEATRRIGRIATMIAIPAEVISFCVPGAPMWAAKTPDGARFL